MRSASRLSLGAIFVFVAFVGAACDAAPAAQPAPTAPPAATSAPAAPASPTSAPPTAPPTAAPTTPPAPTQAAPPPTTAPAPTQAPPAPTTAPAPTQAAPAPAGGNPTAGQAAFSQAGCVACHGDRAQGNVFPGAAKLSATTLTCDQIRAQARSPKDPSKGMPAFPASQVSDQSINDICAWVKSLP